MNLVCCCYCWIALLIHHHHVFANADHKRDNSNELERDLTFLTSDPISITDDTTVEDLDAVYRFVTMIVSKLIGKRALKKEMVNNKGKSPFDIITVSDIAYALTIIENNREKWDQEFSIMYLAPEEQEKWKNRKDLPEEERGSYTKIQPRFTKKKGNKAAYKKAGMNQEGKDYFAGQLSTWKTLFGDRDSWDRLLVGWDLYNTANEWSEQWVAREGINQTAMGGEMEAVRDVAPDTFALPGEEGFGNDRARDEEDEDNSDDDEERSDTGGYMNSGGNKRKAPSRGKMFSSSDESSSESEAEESETDEMPPLPDPSTAPKKRRTTRRVSKSPS